MNNEEWKDIKGYEGLYQVSNWGRVKSLERWVDFGTTTKRKIEEILLKASDNGNGYKCVKLGRNGGKKFVHRLVAEAFIDNPNNYPCINHKDENKTNNNVDNLEWCSYSYNINYGNRTKKALENKKDTKNNIRSKPIVAIDFNGNIKYLFPSIGEAHREGFNLSGISQCCNFKRSSYKNLIWRFIKNNEDKPL